MQYIKLNVHRLGRAFVIFCALAFGIFLCSVYSPAIWYFYIGLAFILAGGLGTIVSLFLTFHPAPTPEPVEVHKDEKNTDLSIVN